jgi:perosamine synthetase
MNNNLAMQTLEALRRVLGTNPQQLHEPSFEGNEWVYLKDCLDSSYVSSVGKYVDKFEKDLATYTGSKYAVAVVNGTAALHIALKLSEVSQEDEVLIPALTFVATANSVAYCNAVPHFVDIEEKTLGIDANKLRQYLADITEQKSGQCVNKKTGRIIRALVPMHTFGHPSDLEGLISVCQEFNLNMVEDAAEAIGSYYKGQHVGTFGLFGTLSFNGNKTITTGGGGAILTNNENLAKKAKHLTTTAKISHKWEFRHDDIGFNYRMPNINAALGCAQLEQLHSKLISKRNLFRLYSEAFDQISGIEVFQEPKNCKSNYWLQTLLLQENQSENLQKILDSTNESKIMTRPSWVLLNELKPFLDCPRMDLVAAKSLSTRIINIPSSPNLGKL